MLKNIYQNRNFNIRFFLFHLCIWMLFLSLPISDIFIANHEFRMSLLVKMLVSIGIFYLNYLVLVPKLLLRGKLFSYSVIAVLVIVFFAFLFTKFDPMNGFRPKFKPLGMPPHDSVSFRMFPNIVLLILHITVSSMFKIYVEWNNSFKREKEAETEKKISELNFLKAQLNPHFFFNALNTIFSLSIQKSEKTSFAILNLSDLMRYMLYETDKEQVRLEEELQYIENYIGLQKFRFGQNTKIRFEVDGNPKSIMVPPLLFISFIENAFKHGISPLKENEILVKFSIENNKIFMLAVNDVHKELPKEESASSGLGLDNTIKRINLYFPGKNTLKTSQTDKKFIVELTLILHEN